MENLGRDSLCEELAGDRTVGESRLSWLRSWDCFRETPGGFGGGGGGVGDFRRPLDCCGLKILPEKAQGIRVTLGEPTSETLFPHL